MKIVNFVFFSKMSFLDDFLVISNEKKEKSSGSLSG